MPRLSGVFLPAGLLLVLLLAWLQPAPGSALERAGLIPWMVATIFLVNGYQTRLRELPGGRTLIASSLIAVVIALLLAPFIGLFVTGMAGLPVAAAMGLVVMATVPPTLSSGIVMTRIAGGNAAKALFLTILLNLIGVVTVPYLLQLLLQSLGDVSLSPLSLLRQLLLIVVLPFAAGALARTWVRLPPRHWLLRYLPSLCVVATVWMAVSASAPALGRLDGGLLVTIALASLAIHASLLLLCLLVRPLYRAAPADWIALLFPVSQKTLPVAVGILAGLDGSAGLALVACILFHFVQLFTDSVIAARLGRRRLS